MTDWWKDVRYGARKLAQRPGFTLAAIVCLALGIGANSAAFSFVDSMLLWTAPVEEPERLVRPFMRWASGSGFGSFSYLDFLDLREDPALEDLAGEALASFHVSVESGNERVFGAFVTANYFEMLGVRAAHGRTFRADEEDVRGTSNVVMLGHGYWQRAFGGDPGIVGETVRLNGHPMTVVGVLPAEFLDANLLIAPDLFVPMTMYQRLLGGRMLEERGWRSIVFVIGRLAPGVTVAQAGEALDARMARLAREYPDSNEGAGVMVLPEAQGSLHPIVRSAFVGFLALMSVVVGLILLLACANVAGLLLARATARRKEVAVRLALGAGRWRIFRQLLTESVLLALLGGGAGLIVGFWLVQLVRTFEPPTELPLEVAVEMNLAVFAFTFVVAVVTGVLFGLAPALQSTKRDVVGDLKEGRATGAGGASWLRRSLVVGQVALSLVLLLVAGMTLRSLQSVGDVDLGFDPDNLATAALEPGFQGYDDDAARRFFELVEERVEALPGVVSAAWGELLPLQFSQNRWGATPEGYEVPEGQDRPSIDVNIVSAGYFETMGTPLLRGRTFRDSDAEGDPVIVVNRAFVERFWPDEEPIGKTVHTGGTDRTVVGVVPTGKYWSLGEAPKPFIFLPFEEHDRGAMVLHYRTEGDPTLLSGPLRRVVGEIDDAMPVSDLKTMREGLGIAFLPARLAAGLVSGFAVLALVLAAVGLYGLISFNVGRGAREIGIRMALGAGAGDVVRVVLRSGVVLTAAGLALGLLAGAGLAFLATRVLYGVSPTDPVAYAAGVVVLGAVALLASWLPARRAARIDPVESLRAE